MAIGYRTNISALKVQRLNDATVRSLGNSYSQLSSGLRINRASDDPAGLAVASGLRADSRIANRARLNVDDGISFLSVADGAYTTARDMLARLSELANQSANGSLSTQQRGALSSEFSALVSEMARLRESTSFNGSQVVQGQPTSKTSESAVTGAAAATHKVSADGRYITYLTGTTLKQLDRQTGATTTIVTGVDSTFDASALGDQVIYTTSSGTKPYIWDRTTGVRTGLGLLASATTKVAISDDGSRYAWVDTSDSYYTINVYDSSTNSPVSEFVGADELFFDIDTIEFSPNGNYLAVTGQNSDFGTVGEGYVYDASAGSLAFRTNLTIEQGSGDITNAVVSNSGRLYFSTNYDLTGNGNTVQLLSTADGFSFTSVASLQGGSGYATSLQIAGDDTLTFLTNADSFGTNSSHLTQAFQVTSGGTLRQLSNYSSNLSVTAFSADGLSAIYRTGDGEIKFYDLRPEYSLTVSAGAGSSADVTSAITSIDGAVRALGSLSILSQRNAREALTVLSDNSDRLGNAVGTLGAGLSRLSSSRRVLLNQGSNLETAADRIRSADIASSVAESTRLQVLADTQSAILAQAARLEPSIALSLLKAA